MISKPWDHQNRNRHQKLCRIVPVSLKILPYFARSWQKCKIIEKAYLQAPRPSESEPPSQTMSDGTGFVENGVSFGPFVARAQNH